MQSTSPPCPAARASRSVIRPFEVLTIAIPLRAAYGLRDMITDRHLDNMGKVMLAAGLIVAYGYLVEHFTAWYSGHSVEQYMIENRMSGPYG